MLNHHDVLDIKYSMEKVNGFVRSHLVRLELGQYSIMYTGIGVLCLFSQFCLVFLYLVPLVRRLSWLYILLHRSMV